MVIENEKPRAKCYGKSDAFSLSIFRRSHLDSNIPSNIYYAYIGFEFLGFAWTSS